MAAAKIRDDLEGVVLLFDGTTLKAGDPVPEGVKVGDHVLAEPAGAGDDGDGEEVARWLAAEQSWQAAEQKASTPARRGSKGHGDNAAGN